MLPTTGFLLFESDLLHCHDLVVGQTFPYEQIISLHPFGVDLQLQKIVCKLHNDASIESLLRSDAAH